MVRIDSSIYDAMIWLKDEPNGTILGSPFIDYPAAAISDKSLISPGVQPMDEVNHLSANDKLTDYNFWHVLTNPNDGKSLELLQYYKIKYIFLLKNPPYYWNSSYLVTVDYEGFRQSPFYTQVFNNSEVGVFMMSPLGLQIVSSLSNSSDTPATLTNAMQNWTIVEGKGSLHSYASEAYAQIRYNSSQPYIGIQTRSEWNLSESYAVLFSLQTNFTIMTGTSIHTTYQLTLFDGSGDYIFWRFDYPLPSVQETYILLINHFTGNSPEPLDLSQPLFLRFQFTDPNNQGGTYYFQITNMTALTLE